jgi:hypothetical protein
VPSGIIPWPWVTPDRAAEIEAARLAEFTFAAFGNIERNDMIARLDRSYADADLHHNGPAFMAHNRRKEPLGFNPIRDGKVSTELRRLLLNILTISDYKRPMIARCVAERSRNQRGMKPFSAASLDAVD